MSFYFYDLSGGINLAQSKTTLGLDTKKVFWAQGENVEIYQIPTLSATKNFVIPSARLLVKTRKLP